MRVLFVVVDKPELEQTATTDALLQARLTGRT